MPATTVPLDGTPTDFEAAAAVGGGSRAGAPFHAVLSGAMVPICLPAAMFQERVIGRLTAGGVEG